ncbi:leucine-rich repeat and calponin homology domain-containing protein 2-like [Anopheles ziemanni]|uniref:leucine-rich repeat and calponin homology domain-containing protein 2-like n=1 Tax=Anopheles coustani TaxID=139045 RepID=UPI0026593CB9|nr:leucine-rich repeat and calponin homology domain-containing protein 2-like [Anopheles coustani]XP_058169432.1 leucine-rich repeat and calponin homology domain-containing protein 2-like [Anopheles ziemanni]
MTVGSVKHPNMLPPPAAASSTRVPSSFDYNGSGAGGRVGGGVGGVGGGGGGGGVVGGNLQTSGRISPNAPSTMTGMTRSSTRRCLLGRPDPTETRRIYDQNIQDERQRSIARYGFDTHTSKFVPSSPPSIASAGLHHRNL